MDGLRKIRDTTGNVVSKGVEKGKEVYTDVKGSEAVGRIVDQGKQVVNSPTTRRITGEVVQQGKEVGQQKVREVKGVVDAGKRGDVEGVIRNGAPLVRDVLIGPEALALKLAKEKAFEALIQSTPPGRQREALRDAKRLFDKTSVISDPSLSRLVEEQLKRQAKDQVVQTVSDPANQHKAVEGAQEVGSRAGRMFRGLGEKLHIVKPREQAEQQRRQ